MVSPVKALHFYTVKPTYIGMNGLFMSLGAGDWQIPMIQAAKRQGLRVISVDRNPEAPGFALSDYQIHCSVRKPATIYRLFSESAIRGELKGIACRSYGSVVRSGAALAAACGTAGPGTAAVGFFRNKRLYKAKLKKLGVRVPDTYSLKTKIARERILREKSVLIARPGMSHGKLGVVRLSDTESRKEFLNIMSKPGAGDENCLIEKEVSGTEITVLGAVCNGAYRTLLVTSKVISETAPLFAEISHRYPAIISDATKEIVDTILQKIVTASGLVTSPFVSEFIIPKKGKPVLVECSPEPGGEFLADQVFPVATGHNYFDWMVHLLTHEEMLPLSKTPDSAIVRFILPRTGILKRFEFPDALMKQQSLLFAKQLVRAGSITSLERGNLDRIAVFALKGPSIEEITELSDLFANRMLVEYENV